MGLYVAEIRANRQTTFLKYICIEGNEEPPLKMEILKIRFFHVRKGPNIDCEPNSHEPSTLIAGDYTGQPKMGEFLTLRVMGSPPLKWKL